MRYSLLCWLFLLNQSLYSIDKSGKWLKQIVYYEQESVYKEKIYPAYDVAQFYQLKEIKQDINVDSIDLHLLNACLFYATNKVRIMHNVSPLEMDNRLLKAAILHSNQMAIHNFFDHQNPYNTKLKTLKDRLKICGVDTEKEIGENCHMELLTITARTYIDLAQSVIESLYNSMPHRKNMLRKNFQFSGVGAAIYKNKNGEVILYVTQDFYRP